MRVKITVEIDLETGAYDMTFNNLSHPGAEIDFTRAREVLGKALGTLNEKLTANQAPTQPVHRAKRRVKTG